MGLLRDLLPKEHGTWAMLLVPFVVGSGVARRCDVVQVLLLVAVVIAFLLYTQAAGWFRAIRTPAASSPARGAVRTRLAALALAATLAAIPALTALPPRDVLALAIVTAGIGIAVVAALAARRERALAGQLLAPVGLGFSAVVAHAVARRALEPLAFALWALCALFFVGGVLYVRLKILALPRRKALGTPGARTRFAAPTLGLLVLVVVLAGLVVWWARLSPLVMLGFTTVAVQALVGAARVDRPASLKRVGLISTAHSVVFAAAVIFLA
jgi:hypothetical protein